MKYVWVIFIIVAIEQIIYNKITSNKKELAIYIFITVFSILLCISYYSNEYDASILGYINRGINLERFVWIKRRLK